jgi:hypothetical protein
MKWLLLFTLILYQLTSSTLVCQPFTLEQAQEQSYEVHVAESLEHPETVIGNSEAFYGSPHYLKTRTNNKQLEPIPLSQQKDDWKVFFVLMALIALGIARFFFSSRIGHFFKAAFGNVSFNQMEREGGFFDETITYLLFFNFLIVFSILLWQTVMFFDLTSQFDFLNPFLLYITVFLLSSVFFLTKSLALGFSAWVFETKVATLAYLKNIFLFNQLTGIVLLGPVVYLAYNPTYQGLIITWLCWFLINMIKVGRGAIVGYKVSAFPGYYLILYLCSVELAPFLLILKLGSKYLITA